MPGPPVSMGCAVLLSPGAAGPPDSGVIVGIMQTCLVAGGMPLAVSGSIAQMVNSVSGAPYPVTLSAGGSASVTVNGQALLRMGDVIPAGPGMATLLGPPAAPYVMDTGA